MSSATSRASVLLVDGVARPAESQREAGEHRELTGEGFRRSNADFGAGEGRRNNVARARDRRGRFIDHRHDLLSLRLGGAKTRQGIGRLP